VRIKVDLIIIGQNLVGKIINAEPPVGHAAHHLSSVDRHRRRGVTATSRVEVDHIIGQNLVGKIISAELPVRHVVSPSSSADRWCNIRVNIHISTDSGSTVW